MEVVQNPFDFLALPYTHDPNLPTDSTISVPKRVGQSQTRMGSNFRPAFRGILGYFPGNEKSDIWKNRSRGDEYKNTSDGRWCGGGFGRMGDADDCYVLDAFEEQHDKP